MCGILTAHQAEETNALHIDSPKLKLGRQSPRKGRKRRYPFEKPAPQPVDDRIEEDTEPATRWNQAPESALVQVSYSRIRKGSDPTICQLGHLKPFLDLPELVVHVEVFHRGMAGSSRPRARRARLGQSLLGQEWGLPLLEMALIGPHAQDECSPWCSEQRRSKTPRAFIMNAAQEMIHSDFPGGCHM